MMSLRNRTLLFRVTAIVLVIAVSALIFFLGDKSEQLAVYGYPGIFIITFLSYATIFLPAPGAALTFTMGGMLNPLLVGLAAGAGAALGELTGYLAGYSGQGIAQRSNMYNRFEKWMHKNGPLAILVLSAIPNPFIDIGGVAAGALKMPVAKFLFWCWIGETIKMLVFAYAGAYSINWIRDLIS